MKEKIAAFTRGIFILTSVFTVSLFPQGPALAEMPADPANRVTYVVDIQGAPLQPPEVERLLREVSQTLQKRYDPPASMAQVKRRAEADLPEMKKVLRSFGFFRGTVMVTINSSEPGFLPDPDNVQAMPDAVKAPPKPVTVKFRIDPGPRFTFLQPSVSLAKDGPPGTLDPPPPAELGILDGAPYSAKQVVAAGNALLNHYKNQGYPFARMAHREVVADFAVNRVALSYEVGPGPHALFGETRITGLERLDPEYVRGLIPWKEGEAYDIRLVNKARRILFDTSLFGMVDFENPDEADYQDRLPITIKLKERAPRTIRLGLEYTTDYGPGVNGTWTHRNLFGTAEKFTTGAVFNSKTRSAFAQFDKPMFLDKNNTVIAQGTFNDETTDAYDARSMDGSTLLKRQFTPEFSAGGGVGFRYSRVREKAGNERNTYRLAYLPLTGIYDTRKDLLNPTQGYEFSVTMAPYQDVDDGDIRFFRYLLSGSIYYNFNSGDKAVFAVRAGLGQIYGIGHDRMPADLRFYAGGGGSVRGYAYQLAGPLTGKTPLGGLSILTFSVEMRFRITDTIGLVPFLDGGTAFLDRVPDFGDQDLLYGGGVGIRYYTAIGPIRLDVAVPLNKRKGVDDSFQFYVSIGQAF